jgi:hypothetical protein
VVDFIANPRRSLRLAIRCAAHVDAYGADCDGHTENLGATGCRLVTPARLEKGSHLRLRLAAAGALGPLAVGATVIWTEDGPPFRHGLHFDAPDLPRAGDWFDELSAGHSELLHQVRVPDRLRLSARLYVTEAPTEAPVLGDEETVVLRYACGQPTVAQLQRVLGPDWSRAQRALFNLLGRGTVTLDEGEAADPQGWRQLLDAERPGAGGRFRS